MRNNGPRNGNLQSRNLRNPHPQSALAAAATALASPPARWPVAPRRHRAPTIPPDVLLVQRSIALRRSSRRLRLSRRGHADHRQPGGRGVRFAQAIAPTPLTLPSHASLFTGVTPMRHGVRENVGFVVGSAPATLAERFQSAGYATSAFISGFPLHRRFGLMRGFDHLVDQLTRGGDRARPAAVERRADETVAAVAAWIDQQTSQPMRPLFLWVHLFDPHAPTNHQNHTRTRFARPLRRRDCIHGRAGRSAPAASRPARVRVETPSSRDGGPPRRARRTRRAEPTACSSTTRRSAFPSSLPARVSRPAVWCSRWSG